MTTMVEIPVLETLPKRTDPVESIFKKDQNQQALYLMQNLEQNT
jgi:hypothetical protein